MSHSILITGANGQLGTVLTQALQLKYGLENVIASDLHPSKSYEGIFEVLDVTNVERLEQVILQYEVKQIYHLAAILSANGEKNPLRTWEVNMKALLNVLEASRINHVDKVFYPSSIAVFGESAPQTNTPNDSLLDPVTSYGLSKAAGENWGKYYFHKYGLDVRSLRYPGIIGHQSNPGGGTTDYAVEIFHKAVKQQPFTCFLDEETTLPMIFMDDAVRATLELMEAPRENIKIRTSYNIAGISFSPAQVVDSIREKYPEFKVEYAPDYRQDIASKWPKSILDKEAHRDWSWKPRYSLSKITKTMIDKLENKYAMYN
ncbi:NAD-dependent epimerase/dehydratase family protein [Flagellimonas sp.]|uniref:NAD-dependent epimerase/dehydratase family protein n=1 Tax=Flagellimonas sp. TaxID=2058762 RepID=UPI003B5A2742